MPFLIAVSPLTVTIVAVASSAVPVTATVSPFVRRFGAGALIVRNGGNVSLPRTVTVAWAQTFPAAAAEQGRRGCRLLQSENRTAKMTCMQTL